MKIDQKSSTKICWVHIHESRVKIHELPVEIHEFKVIISVKNQVNGYQSFTRILKIRSDVINFASERNFKQAFV